MDSTCYSAETGAGSDPTEYALSPLLARLCPQAIDHDVCEVHSGVALDELSDSPFFKANTAM